MDDGSFYSLVFAITKLGPKLEREGPFERTRDNHFELLSQANEVLDSFEESLYIDRGYPLVF